MRFISADVFDNQPAVVPGFRTLRLVANGPFVNNTSDVLDNDKIDLVASQAHAAGQDILWDVEHLQLEEESDTDVPSVNTDFLQKVGQATARVKLAYPAMKCYLYPLATHDDVNAGFLMDTEPEAFDAWVVRRGNIRDAFNLHDTADGIVLDGYDSVPGNTAQFLRNLEVFLTTMVALHSPRVVVPAITPRLQPIDFMDPTASPFMRRGHALKIRAMALRRCGGFFYWQADTTIPFRNVRRYPVIHAMLNGWDTQSLIPKLFFR